MSTRPEVWLRGPLPDVPEELAPVVHSLLQVREELEEILPSLSFNEIWTSPGGAASIGFHVRHLAGSLDRLLTYARGQQLSARQREALAHEQQPASADDTGVSLLEEARGAIDRAIDQVSRTPICALDEARAVGRDRLPSTVLGLLYHAAEHAQRHAGQIATTAIIVGKGKA